MARTLPEQLYKLAHEAPEREALRVLYAEQDDVVLNRAELVIAAQHAAEKLAALGVGEDALLERNARGLPARRAQGRVAKQKRLTRNLHHRSAVRKVLNSIYGQSEHGAAPPVKMYPIKRTASSISTPLRQSVSPDSRGSGAGAERQSR